MSKTRSSRLSYRTTNWPSYNAALKSRGSLTIWLDKRMQWFTSASGKRGRSPRFSYAAIQFCLTIKNLFGLALRQTIGFVESLLHLSGLHWPVSDFSTVCRRQHSLQVHVPYRSSQAGLHLLMDSTGIRFLGEGEWKCKKHGPERRRQWRKLHIGIDAQTLQIRAICVASNDVSDAAVVAQMLDKSLATRLYSALPVMVPMTPSRCMKRPSKEEPFPSFTRGKMHEYAKAMPLRIAMRLSPHADTWAEGYVVITGAA